MNTQIPPNGRRLRHAVALSTIGVAALCALTLNAQTSGSSGSASGGSTYGSSSSSSGTTSPSNSSVDRSRATTSTSGTYGSSGTTQAPSTSGSSVSDSSSSYSTSLARGDRRFVTKASEMNNEEIRLSQLAAQQASDPQVRNYAQMLVDEHSQTGTELSAIASRKGVAAVSRDDYDERAASKLSKKTGRDFDKAYLEKMADAHEDVIDVFEKQAKNGKDPELQAFASKMLPKLREHEEHAKSLEKSVK